MTPEELEELKADIKAKKAERDVEHQELRAEMNEKKKEIDDLITKAKAVKRKP